MSIYAEQIFPRLMDWVMSGSEFQQLRASQLQQAQGEVLEIGLGTGLNLSHYPHDIRRLEAVEPAMLLPDRVAQRIRSVSFPVQITRVSAETLPFDDHRFDCAVSTWTLCTIPDPIKALREIRRVLKPEGTFLFLEHGRSDDERIARWQERLNPLQRILACGCNLDRRIDRLIEQAGLTITDLDRVQMESVPRVGGALYRGVATPSS